MIFSATETDGGGELNPYETDKYYSDDTGELVPEFASLIDMACAFVVEELETSDGPQLLFQAVESALEGHRNSYEENPERGSREDFANEYIRAWLRGEIPYSASTVRICIAALKEFLWEGTAPLDNRL